jgi:hypothetical protein
VVRSGIPIAGAEFPLHEDDPAVAWHNGIYLVVWSSVVDDDTWPGAVSDIHGARVDPAGIVLDPSPLPISTAPSPQHRPDVAFNGRFLVTWTDLRRIGEPGEPEADLYGAMVSPAGTAGSEFLIGSAEPNSRARVSAIPGDDDVAVAYSRYLPEEPYGTTRAFLRRVSPK